MKLKRFQVDLKMSLASRFDNKRAPQLSTVSHWLQRGIMPRHRRNDSSSFLAPVLQLRPPRRFSLASARRRQCAREAAVAGLGGHRRGTCELAGGRARSCAMRKQQFSSTKLSRARSSLELEFYFSFFSPGPTLRDLALDKHFTKAAPRKPAKFSSSTPRKLHVANKLHAGDSRRKPQVWVRPVAGGLGALLAPP